MTRRSWYLILSPFQLVSPVHFAAAMRNLAFARTIQILVSLFAEDIDLLPKYFVTQLLAEITTPASSYDGHSGGESEIAAIITGRDGLKSAARGGTPQEQAIAPAAFCLEFRRCEF